MKARIDQEIMKPPPLVATFYFTEMEVDRLIKDLDNRIGITVGVFVDKLKIAKLRMEDERKHPEWSPRRDTF